VDDARPAAGVRRSRARRGSPRALPRALAVAACAALLAGLAYVVARETSLFAVRAVEAPGASEGVAAAVEDTLGDIVGTSLVAVDAQEVVSRLEALPTVVSASVDRDFPHTLRVTVREERAVAVVRYGDGAWLVSARGRVMEAVEPGDVVRLPRVWLGSDVVAPRPGVFLLPDEGGLAVHALSRVPQEFPVRIASARGSPDDLVLVVDGSKAELRLGEASELRVKLAVAATVLESLGAQGRQELEYLDVSLPTRPVGASKAQVEA
jgi:cell division protein FtsQ